jgi:uncharacterized SAM-binding protein YcdF (DUF218 family)
MFLVKKMVGMLLTPLNLALLGLLFAIVFTGINAKVSFWSLMFSFSVLFYFSAPFTANLYMKSIEGDKSFISEPIDDIEYILVLGSYYSDNENLPETGRLSKYGLERVVEGIRLWVMHPGSIIIFSGGSIGTDHTYAYIAGQAAISLGVPKNNIVIEERPIDTQQEAFYVKQPIGDAQSILVTNANHMLRASKYFENEGINFVKAKTGFYDKNVSVRVSSIHSIIPNAQKLNQSAAAMYERIGLLWQKIK